MVEEHPIPSSDAKLRGSVTRDGSMQDDARKITTQRVVLPDHLRAYAVWMAKRKNPDRRTAGWSERAGERSGSGLELDIIGSTMLWARFAELHVPITQEHTARTGDRCDLYVPVGGKSLTINVKTSRWTTREDNDGDYVKASHIAVKSEELQKPLPTIFMQVFVHLDCHDGSPDHVHFARWITTADPAWSEQAPKEIPNSNGWQGLWIPPKHTNPPEDLVPRVAEWVRKARQAAA